MKFKSLLVIVIGNLVLSTSALAFLPKEFSATFESVYKGQISGKEKRSQGELFYQHPSHMRFEMKAPDPLIFVADGSKSWYYRPPFIEGEAGELRLGDANKLGILKIFDLLGRELKNNQEFKVSEFTEGQILDFIKKKKDHDVKNVKLFFAAKPWTFESLTKIELKFDDGKISSIVFQEKKKLEAIAKEKFTFVAPENTNITKQ
jgi:outer membrane lipoprotein-sorting protein